MINYKSKGKIHESESGSIVLRVSDKDTGRDYALKLIGPLNDKLKNLIFKREIDALRILNRYDDIVKIYDSEIHMQYGTHTNMGAILLEYVEGPTLDEIDISELTELKKYDLCLKILKAIANAHSNSIIHRDIKPDNIKYLNGKVKIIDFGNSKIKSIIERETTVSMFSPLYSAPEVVAGGETTEASDLYSLGVVFFKILLSIEPTSNEKMRDLINLSTLSSDLQSLLLKMLEPSLDNRLSDVDEAITVFENKIGQLNVNAHKFWFSIDSSKLKNLKDQYVIEESMTMSHLTSTFLPKDFKELYGTYDKNSDLYKFIGNQLYMECFYDTSRELFNISKIYSIPIDRRIKLQKFYCKIEGTLEFIDLIRKVNINRNNNRQLLVILSNHVNEMKTLENKTNLFENLFGKWKQSLYQSIDTTKSKNGKITYSNYSIDDNRLTLVIKEYENNVIDNIDVNMNYIFESDEQGWKRTHIIGSFEDVQFDDNEILFSIKLDPKSNKSKIRQFLEEFKPIFEDYMYKINSFRKQITAINALQNDECSARNLKDIILELEVPTQTPHIKNIKYHNKDLNDSQKNAVNKALFSDSLSLIQGPPGTGKTKVINEILYQLVVHNDSPLGPPKILVVSQSHTAVDNILEGIDLKNIDSSQIIRIGDKKNVAKEIFDKHTIDSLRSTMFSSVKEKSNSYIDDKLKLLEVEQSQSTKELGYEESKWLRVKEIQEEWIKRCGDYDSFDYQLISSATIIAGTCVGYLSNQFVRDMYFDYVIVDEAAKATTPELLVSIIKAQKIILVGDQNQLSPFADSSLSSLSEELTKDPKFRLFDILFDALPPDTHRQVLTTQYRMIRNIGDLISKTFYDGTINTGIDDEKRRYNIPFYGNYSIIWYNTSKLKDHWQKVPSGGSYINISENNVIKSILGKINAIENAKSIDIGIITGYRAQKDLIRKSVSNCGFSGIGKIDINTLDAFQGRENDIIIYSTVRTSNSIGFQKEKERINVAFSRARKLLIVVGDLDFFYNWDHGENKYVYIIDYIKENTATCQIIDLKEGDLGE